ncbi:GNAT family N-acetyltransferase [Halalkalicoccus sp. NIPERK01]|uniref:GNAT family N-acetyltransferase n=1 Tax=Halalkalicoccus sp. NIPERK01 TaxID=3053469 RepID=UPI00256F556D|nr:GNAT family N-acetyltransferase [Halalkalicoccus sp. NIPERK01]MDL5361623.1 GNAT family N-acetyltransferase [Halalkalicoccus sp. NIPERK01]
MEIREATPGDAEIIQEVHVASITELGPEAYSESQVEAWAMGCKSADYAGAIESDDAYFVVAEDREGVRGFGSLSLDPSEGYEASVDAEVTGVYVDPSVARRGVGSAILADLERHAREHGVRTLGLSASLNALPFYEAHGYERVREYRHEFSAHESTAVEGTVVEMTMQL